MKEYPTSSWKKHSDSLIDLIAVLNRKIKSLKGENLSLTKENKELRLNIEKLKILDIEQELKVKR
jgi:FtsZ-binding cell division protein ZapB